MSSFPSSSSSATTPDISLVLQVQPGRAESARDLTGLETAMQSFSLESRSPVALELAAFTRPAITHSFLLRADNAVALAHLATQVQARYPQANIHAVKHDPLHISTREECSAVELLPAAAAYFPLRTFRAQDVLREGVDPLLGVLAAFHQLPPGARAVVQLALLPASPTWTASHQRLAVERVQEQDRQKYAAASQKAIAPGMGKIAALCVLVALLALASRFQKVLIPAWLIQAGLAILYGRAPALSVGQIITLGGIAVALLALLGGGARLFSSLATRFARPVISDSRSILEKMARPAYQTRLRLFVIMPGNDKPPLAGQAPTPLWITRVWFKALKTSVFGGSRHIGKMLVTLKKHVRLVPFHRRPCVGQPCSFRSWLLQTRSAIPRTFRTGAQWTSAVHADWRTAWHEWHEWQAAMRMC